MLHDGIDKEVFFINKTFGKLLVIRYYPSFPRKWLTIKMPKDKQNTMTTPNNNACCLLSAAFIEHMWFKSAFAIKKLLPTLAPRRTSLQYVRNFVNCRLKKGNVHSHIGYRMFLHSYLGSTWAVSPCHHTILRETCAELIERSSRTAVARQPALAQTAGQYGCHTPQADQRQLINAYTLVASHPLLGMKMEVTAAIIDTLN